jgi:hypothetical protein
MKNQISIKKTKKYQKLKKTKKHQKLKKISVGGVLGFQNSNDNEKLSKLLIKYENFLPFFEENKHKIMIPESDIGKHPVNDKVFNRIQTRIKTSNEDGFYRKISLLFLTYLRHTIRYVNFNEYLSKIKSVCENIQQQIINDDKYEVIILCGQSYISKSNLWVLLLSLNCLNESLLNAIKDNGKEVYICSNCIDVYRELKPLKSKKKIAIIYFDDMAYSGQQINNNTPDPKNEISSYSNDYSFKDNVDIFLGIGFISENAKQLLTRNNKCIIFENTEIILSNENQFYKWLNENSYEFDMFDEENKKLAFTIFYKKMCRYYIKDNIIPSNISDDKKAILYDLINIPDEVIDAFNCNQDNILIYFDHKLADSVSTLYKFLRFGTYPIIKDYNEKDPNSVCKYESIIKGCSPYKVPIDLCRAKKNEFSLNSEHACPIDFYKKIDYTFNGTKLDEYKNIMQIY